MSAISSLAQTFEQNAKQQASDTRQAVQSALQQHERDLIAALRSSEQSLSAAIQRREQMLSSLLDETERKTRATVLNSWRWLAGSLLAVALLGSGALWWTGQQIEQNLTLIEQQRQTMARAQALGVEFMQHNGSNYIVLPHGVTARTGLKSGQREALKLERR